MNQLLVTPSPLRRVGLTRDKVVEILKTKTVKLDALTGLPVRENRHYPPDVREKIRILVSGGMSKNGVARAMGIPRGTITYLTRDIPAAGHARISAAYV